MTDPDAPPPLEPQTPDDPPGSTPDEVPLEPPPVQPGDDRPYGAAPAPFPPVTSPD
jgi:hypothetical protein